MPPVTSPDLLRGIYRAQAFERAAGGEPAAHELVAPVALAAGLEGDARPDVLTLCAGAASASLMRGLGARDLARYQAADVRRGRVSHEIPGLGRSGYRHPTFHSLGLIGPIPTPGASVTVAAGAALAFRLRAEARIAVVVESAAAAASGGWHEGLNLAAAQRAPLVVVLLNEPGRTRRSTVAQRGLAYGVRAERLPGGSAGSLARRIGEVLAKVRSDPGTWLLEIDPLPDGAITEMEARLVQGGGKRSQVELDELTAWSAEAEQEALAAWSDLERPRTDGVAA